MSSWVTHLCKGFERFLFFLGEGLQAGGHFFLFTGKSGPITGGLISWGEGLRCKENKTKRTLLYLMLYFSLSKYLERVIISYIAVLSYLEQ